MLYYDFEAGNRVYKLRLNTRNIIVLEKLLGCNPIAIFGNGSLNSDTVTMPTVDTMVNILHCAMQQYEHGIALNDAYSIFDDFIADGNTITDFIKVIIEVYRVSGILPKEGEAEKN